MCVLRHHIWHSLLSRVLVPTKVQHLTGKADISVRQLELVAAALLRRSATGTAGIHMGNWAVPWHRMDAEVAAHARVTVAPE